MPPEAVSIVDILAKASAVTLFAFAIVGGYFELWYYGPAVRRRLDEKDKQLADKDKQIEKWEKISLELLMATRVAVEKEEQRLK